MSDMDVLAIAQRIERDLREPLSFESLAALAACSTRHLQRRFVEATAEGVMEYVRGRRLTVAMHDVLQGTRRILDIAIEFQFGSQEAFARAFQARFAFPPRRFQHSKLTTHPACKPPLTRGYLAMIASGALGLQPEIIDGTARRLIGLTARIPIGAQSTPEGFAAIGAAIGRFRAALAPLQNATTLLAAPLVLASYRVPEPQRAQGDGILIRPGLDAVLFKQIPDGFTEQAIPACRFAAFRYSGPGDGLRQVGDYIMGTWFPRSDWWFGTAPALSELARQPDGTVNARLLLPLRRRNPRSRDTWWE